MLGATRDRVTTRLVLPQALPRLGTLALEVGLGLLALGPDALVLDLGRGEREALAELLADWGPEPPVLVVSESVDGIVRRARSIAFFADGRLEEHGPTPELLTRPRSSALETFLRRGAAG